MSPDSPPRRKICAVTVVPMLAPIITPTAWRSFRIPALTKPMHITVVAAEEWTMPATTAPSSTPLKILSVSFSSSEASLPLVSFSRPVVMVDIPNRNVARAPSRAIKSGSVKIVPPSLCSFTVVKRPLKLYTESGTG